MIDRIIEIFKKILLGINEYLIELSKLPSISGNEESLLIWKNINRIFFGKVDR